MGTTDGSLASSVLRALEDSGVRFAVLHGETSVAAEQVESDVDLIVDRPGRSVIGRSLSALHAVGLHPVLVWPNGVHAVTFFLATATGADAVQLDLTYDPEGCGEYGVRTDIALGGAVPGERWPRLAAEHELLYLIRKRQLKKQPATLAALLEENNDRRDELIAQAESFLGTRAAARVKNSLRGDPPTAPLPRVADAAFSARKAARLLGRLQRPAGFWITLHGGAAEMAARELASRFARFLDDRVRCEARPTSATAQAPWWARRVAPVYLRAWLVVTYGTRDLWPRPDLVLSASEYESVELAGALVRGMEARALSQLPTSC